MRFRGRRQQCVPAEQTDTPTGVEADTSTIKSETREKCAELQRGITIGPNTPKQPLNIRTLPLNEGWHQYDIPDIGQAVKIRYPSVNGDAELRLDANESLRVAGNTLQMQRLDGRVVISAHKELAGLHLTVEADNYTGQPVIVIPEARESSETKREQEQAAQEGSEAKEKQPTVLFVDKVGDREFLIPKENAPLFIRYDQTNNQGSMVGWYDMQPDVVRSEHEHFVVDGRDQPFLRFTIQPNFTGDIQLWRNNRQEVIHVDPKEAGVDQSPERTLVRTKGLLEWLQSQLREEDVITCEQAHGYKRGEYGGRALSAVLSEALEKKDAVQAVEKILQSKENKLKNMQSSLGSTTDVPKEKETN